MNRLINFSLACLVAAACLFSSCNKDDWKGKTENPNSDLQRCPDAYLLLGSFLDLDENGNVTGCYYGSYDPANPGVVNITVKKTNPVEWAREFMKSIIPEDADITETEDELIWNMKNSEGKSQGQMVFKRSTALGQFAVVEVPECARPLTQIVFKKPLLTDSWIDRYNQCDLLDYFYLGAPFEVRDGKLPEGVASNFGHGQGLFLVIREYEAGVHNGLLLRLETEEKQIAWPDDIQGVRNRCMRYPVGVRVSKILNENPGFAQTMTSMGMGSWDTGYYVWYEPLDVPGERFTFASNEVRLNFKTGEGETLSLFWKWYFHEAWLYKFYVEEVDGALRVFINRDLSGGLGIQ